MMCLLRKTWQEPGTQAHLPHPPPPPPGPWPSSLLSQAPRFSVRDSALPVEVAAFPESSLHPFFVPAGPLLCFLLWAPEQHRLLTKVQGDQSPRPVPLLLPAPPRALPTGLWKWLILSSQIAYVTMASWSPTFLISWVNDTALWRLHKHSVRLCAKVPGTRAKQQE